MTANANGPGAWNTSGRFETHRYAPDYPAPAIVDQAAQVIEGEAYAAAYLDRLRIGTANPGELAVIIAFLRGEMLHGACRLIEKALEGRHHA